MSKATTPCLALCTLANSWNWSQRLEENGHTHTHTHVARELTETAILHELKTHHNYMDLVNRTTQVY